MTTHSIYQVDAFASRPFEGNPAAVVPLAVWLDDATLLAIAAENNLAETAFFTLPDTDGRRHLRWFTPEVEVPLCGHATLASAAVLFDRMGETGDTVRFMTKSGELTVKHVGESTFTMDFPANPPGMWEPPTVMTIAMSSVKAFAATDAFGVAELPDEAAVRRFTPDLQLIKDHVPGGCLIVTAEGETHDFVSRFFGPGVGIDEDPVTGAAHCILTPYWAKKLKRDSFTAFQASKRGGEIGCAVRGDRVILTGTVVHYLSGEITI